MKVTLARVDERLIHGQVSVGWIPRLRVDHILIADADAAGDAWERDLICSAAPPGIPAEVLSPADAVARLGSDVPGSWLLLLRSLSSAVELFDGEDRPEGVNEINVGGLHFKEGTRRFLDYVYLSPEDVDSISTLHARGIRLFAQDVPGAKAVDLSAAWVEGKLEFDKLPVRHS